MKHIHFIKLREEFQTRRDKKKILHIINVEWFERGEKKVLKLHGDTISESVKKKNDQKNSRMEK